MAHTYNPSIQQSEAGGSLGIWGQSELHSKFQARPGYSVSLFKISQEEEWKRWQKEQSSTLQCPC